MSLTTRKNVKERIDPKTGDIIRTYRETSKVWERIDATTGKVKDQIVSVEMQSPKPKARGAKAKCDEMIKRITKMVQDLEINYTTGNAIVECLKNHKFRPKVKKHKLQYFIDDKDKILMLFEKKYGTDKETHEVAVKTISLLEEILQNIESFELEQHWHEILVKKHKQRCEVFWQDFPKEVLREKRWRKEITKNNSCLRRWYECWHSDVPSWELKETSISSIVNFYIDKCSEAGVKLEELKNERRKERKS